MKHRALVCRKFVLSTCRQAEDAPLIDQCWGSGESRREYKHWPRMPLFLAPERRFKIRGVAVLLRPWTKDPQRALVFGWIISEEAL